MGHTAPTDTGQPMLKAQGITNSEAEAERS